VTQQQTPVPKPEAHEGRLRGFDLTGRRAMVFGVDAPAGLAIAEAFREAGATVGSTSAQGGMAGSALAESIDIANADEVRDAIGQFRDSFGGLDVAVVVPTAYHAGPIGDTLDAELSAVIGGNLVAAYNVFRSASEAMSESEHGRLIAVVSAPALRGIANLTAFAAAQAGIVGLVRALSQELGSEGITVNAIATGWMQDSPGRGPDAVERNQLLRYVPMRRFGAPDEVAPLAVYLASNASGYFNGQAVAVDGGLLKHL
jgi:NAD(P)-dependent dehydrogenase (short-subunit alcohol dehydrogenase family)